MSDAMQFGTGGSAARASDPAGDGEAVVPDSRGVGVADGVGSSAEVSTDIAAGRRADAPPAKRSIVKSVKFNDDEWRQVERIAKRRGIAPSTLLRAAALDLDDDRRLRAVKTAEVAPPVSPELEALRDELRDLRVQYKGAASNLNQLTRLSNFDHSLHQHVEVDGQQVSLVDLMIETRNVAREVLSNLGAKGHG